MSLLLAGHPDHERIAMAIAQCCAAGVVTNVTPPAALPIDMDVIRGFDFVKCALPEKRHRQQSGPVWTGRSR